MMPDTRRYDLANVLADALALIGDVLPHLPREVEGDVVALRAVLLHALFSTFVH